MSECYLPSFVPQIYAELFHTKEPSTQTHGLNQPVRIFIRVVNLIVLHYLSMNLYLQFGFQPAISCRFQTGKYCVYQSPFDSAGRAPASKFSIFSIHNTNRKIEWSAKEHCFITKKILSVHLHFFSSFRIAAESSAEPC